MKEIRYNMLISQCESRTGKEKVIANEEERRGPEKDAHLMTPSLMCRLSPRLKKKTKRDQVFFLGPPPLLHRGLTWFYEESPRPH